MQPQPCLHCGAATPEGGDGYCCTGCRVARALLENSGLDRYYKLAGDAPLPSGQTPTDRPWLAAIVEDGAANRRVDVDVQGITCAACVWVIEKLGERAGVACHVNPGLGRIDLAVPEGEEERARLDRFLDDVESVGYRLGPPRKAADQATDELLLRTGISAALAMNAMIFAFARYFGLDAKSDGDVATWFRAGEVLVATGSVLVGGTWFFRSAGRALRRGVIHLDLPIALGVALAYGGSLLSAWFSTAEAAYFDTVSMFVALMLLGRLAQRRLLSQSRLLLLADEGLDALTVRRLEPAPGGFQTRAVPASALRAGDRLLVAPRDVVPVASRVVEGEAAFSLAWITGESEPEHKSAGRAGHDELPAGAHHAGQRAVIVEAKEDMASSRLHTLLQQRSADADDPDSSPFWRAYATISVIAVLVLAAVAFAAWWHEGPVRALEVTTAVLVVTCPCAIGLAIPLAVELASGRLRRRGVYLRRPGLLDRLLHVEHVVFDKTGTLTVSDLRVDDRSRAAVRALSDDDRGALYNLCARSSHPKSRAVAAALEADGRVALVPGLVVEEVPGRGLACAPLDVSLFADAFVRGGVERARLSFEEVLQGDAAAEVAALRARGLDVHLASGDVAARVRDVAVRLGLDEAHAHAGMTPEDKATLVRGLGGALPAENRVLVIGDGVNDAPAFAAAGCAGTPALDRPQLPARADFVFVGKGVGPLDELFASARLLRRAALAAVSFAVVYNTIAVGLAITGRMTPLLCALLMPASSLLVITIVSLLMREPSKAAPAAQLREVTA